MNREFQYQKKDKSIFSKIIYKFDVIPIQSKSHESFIQIEKLVYKFN